MINESLCLALYAWAACAFIMVCVWFWAWYINNAGVVDIFWAFNFTVIALLVYFLGTGNPERKILSAGLLLIWSLRLGIYLLIRVGSHLKEEEGRYKALRNDWAPNANTKFFIFFQMQAVSNIFLAIPFFLMAANGMAEICVFEMAGALITGIAILGEGIADFQLKQFKSNPANKGKVCQAGLWNYSRHPNYFFQLLLWVGVFVMALATPYGWVSIVCPLSIGYLIFKVTGIPMTEEQALRSKGEAYKEYQRTTSVFIPWFKKS
jgi:steroid 5-alpha reductase family enzyme